MDQDGRGRPPPGEFGSFDLSKKSQADVAAELAAQMARWRQARKQPDAPARGPPATEPASRPPVATAPTVKWPTAEPSAAPSAAGPSTARLPIDGPPMRERFAPPTDGGLAIATHIHRARRIAAQTGALQTERAGPLIARAPRPLGPQLKSLLAEGPNVAAIGMRPDSEPDQAPPAAAPATVLMARRAGAAAPWPRTRSTRRVLQDLSEDAWQCAGAIMMRTQHGAAATWRQLEPALRAGIDRGLTRARAIAYAARGAAGAAWHTSKSEIRNLPARAPSAGVLGAAASQLATDKLVIASTAAIVVALGAWLLASSDPTAPPEAAPLQRVDSAPAPDEARASTRQMVEPPQPPAAMETRPPDTTSAHLLARLKPIPPVPVLAVRLKPIASEPVTPRRSTQTDAPPEGQNGKSAGEIRKPADPRAADDMLNRMFQ